MFVMTISPVPSSRSGPHLYRLYRIDEAQGAMWQLRVVFVAFNAISVDQI